MKLKKEIKTKQMNTKKHFLLLMIIALWVPALAQSGGPEAEADTLPSHWTKTLSLGLSYNQVTLDNPLVGDGQNQIVGNAQLSFSAVYDKGKVYWPTDINWNFGLLRIGAGPIEPGSSQKIPFQKTLDQLQVASLVGYRLSQDSTFSVFSSVEIYTQALPAYVDAKRQLPGLFLSDIRDTSINPIQSTFFAPATIIADIVGIGYQPNPKLFIGYSPAAYKGILVLNDAAASLVGKVDDQGLPTATVHGNAVEVVNGAPVFKRSFNQLGSRLLAMYRDKYFKGRFGLNSRLNLFANYLENPGNIDVYWQNRFDLNIIKGLSLSYHFELFYDHDVLVRITDKDAPGGFTGEFGRRVALRRQLMLRYQATF